MSLAGPPPQSSGEPSSYHPMVTAEHAERIRQWHDRAVVAVDINPHAVETAQRTE